MYHTLISADDLQANLDQPLVICDCRYNLADKTAGRHAYQDTHIPGAVYLDLHDDLSGPPVTNKGRHPLLTDEAMNQLFSRIGISSDTQVIVYDDSAGAFAARLWWMLKHMQHECVAVLDGGWQTWINAGYPVSDKIPESVNSHFKNMANNDDLVLIDEVEKYECLIDSREVPRYLGEIEPIDPIAGHIPGAKNRFWKENLTEDGVFKSPEDLGLEWRQILESIHSDQTVVYCGSGVTACHNLLAASHAGLAMPKLYAGSWSEWSNTPGKSIETGGE